MTGQQLPEELYKPIIRKLETRKLYSYFIDNNCLPDFADMQLISKFNKGFRFLLCGIDIYGKYASGVPLKNKKGITITNVFQKFLDESSRKLNKIWLNKGSEFYNRSMKSWLLGKDTEMYSTHNEGKSFIVEP